MCYQYSWGRSNLEQGNVNFQLIILCELFKIQICLVDLILQPKNKCVFLSVSGLVVSHFHLTVRESVTGNTYNARACSGFCLSAYIKFITI